MLGAHLFQPRQIIDARAADNAENRLCHRAPLSSRMVFNGIAAMRSSRFAAEIGHRIAEHAVNRIAFALVESLFELDDPFAYDFDRRAYRRSRDDAGYADVDARLFAREQDFIEPLARP